MAGELEDVGQHAAGRGLAVGAGDRRDRDAARAVLGEQHFHHRPGNVARLALAGRDVHAEAGRGIDLADAAADVLVGLGDVLGQEIDAADVEADRHDGAHRHLAIVGMDDVGDVDRGAAGREVGGRAQEDGFARRRHAVPGVAALGEVALRLVVALEPGQHLLMADAAPRVAVHLLDQLGHGLLAVADDVAGDPLGDGDQLAIDHQHAVVEALDEGLDDDRVAVLAGALEGGLDLLFVGQPDADAAAVIGVERLDHHRIADALGLGDGVARVVDQLLARHRQAEIAEDADGLLLVRGDRDRDVPGLAGDRRLDTALEAAMAELDQALVVEADPGNVARLGGADQRAGAGAERAALGKADEAVALMREVELRRRFGLQVGRQQMVDQRQRQLAGLEPDLGLLVLVDHVVVAGRAGGAGLAEGDLGTGHVL